MFGLEGSASTAMDVSIIVLLTILAGCVSGLTLSLFSIDETYLKTLAEAGDKNPVKARQAQRILRVVKTPHWLLVTLLVCNAGAIEAMPLLLDELLNPGAAIAISVVLVLIFGEVIPQAVFVRHALPIGAFFSYPLQFLMLVTSPVSWVVGKLLDVLVGHRTAVLYRRHELAAFLMLQQELSTPLDGENNLLDSATYNGKPDSYRRSVELLHDANSPLLSGRADSRFPSSVGDPNRLAVPGQQNLDRSYSVADRVRETFVGVDPMNQPTDNEIGVMLGVLSLAEGTALSAIKTRPDDFICVSADAVISPKLVSHVFLSGFSRILVHEATHAGNIIGYIRAKDLVRFAIEPKPKVAGAAGGGEGCTTNKGSETENPASTAPQRVATSLNMHTILTIEANVGLRQLYRQFLVPSSPQIALIVDSTDTNENTNKDHISSPTSEVGRTVYLKRTGPGSMNRVAAPSNQSLAGLLADAVKSDLSSHPSPPPSEVPQSSLRVLGLVTMADLMEYMHKASFPDETDRNLPDQILRRIRQQEALHDLKIHHAPKQQYHQYNQVEVGGGRRATGAVMASPLLARTPVRGRATTEALQDRPVPRNPPLKTGYGAM